MFSRAHLVAVGALMGLPVRVLVVALVFFSLRFSKQPAMLHPTVVLLITAAVATIPPLWGVPTRARDARGAAIGAGAGAALALSCLLALLMAIDSSRFYYIAVAAVLITAVANTIVTKGSMVVAMCSTEPLVVLLGHGAMLVAVPLWLVASARWGEPALNIGGATHPGMALYFAGAGAVALATIYFFITNDPTIRDSSGDDDTIEQGHGATFEIPQDVELKVTDDTPLVDVPGEDVMTVGIVAGTYLVLAALPYFAFTVFPADPQTNRSWFTPISWLAWGMGEAGAYAGSVWWLRRVIITKFDKLRSYVFIRPLFWLVFAGCNIKGRGPWWGGDGFYLLVMVAFGWTHGQCIASAVAKLSDRSFTPDRRQVLAVYFERMAVSGLIAGLLCLLLVLWYFDASIHQR